MLVDISGSRCISCARFVQYYSIWGGGFQRIDCGFCCQRQCITRPGNRCRHYREKGNAGGAHPVFRTEEGPCMGPNV